MRFRVEYESSHHLIRISAPLDNGWTAYNGELQFPDESKDWEKSGGLSIVGSLEEFKELRKAVDDTIEVMERQENETGS